MKSTIFALILAFGAIACVGCGGGKPAGIPALCPATVKVVNGSAPVVGANVFLVPTSVSGSWSVSGVTDSTGTATIKTSQGDWSGTGAPADEYKIYITKLAQIEEPEMPSDMENNKNAEAEDYAERLKRLEAASKEIPKVLNDASTSGLSISVTSSGGEETIDVGIYN